ncbi:2,4'-dihydroxyacetophenone dioxygenase family protein [Variovorax soli]|uniref:2,4'-dihydroxyacetophenone dioxygenase family protein n=1 Tax=Variovorax soli TaxID=376815 RepID=UPI0008384158|nr:2,4'-dihydroxyacetophenone dioxygenase family protein [Variovorax soli]
MLYEQIHTAVIEDESIPWVPFAPYSNEVLIKYFKCDPIRGETITLLKAPAGTVMPRHRHTGTVIVYTVKGSWKYVEHDWIAGPGSIVFETAGSSHTPQALQNGEEVITLNIVVGDLLFVNEQDQILAIESWKSGVDRYLAFCTAAAVEPVDITAFG